MKKNLVPLAFGPTAIKRGLPVGLYWHLRYSGNAHGIIAAARG